MEAKLIYEERGQKTFALVFQTGDEVVSEMTNFARENSLDAASITAIGAFSGATLGYFDIEQKEYERIPVEEQVEVLSLVGDVALNRGEAGAARPRGARRARRHDQGRAPAGGPRAADAGSRPGRVAGAPEEEDGRGDGPRPDRPPVNPRDRRYGHGASG